MGKETKWLRGSQGDERQVNGLLDKGCSFEGKLTFDGSVQINGGFRGEILSDGTLIIGPDAHVAAKIQVDTLIIDGSVDGVIEAKTRIELRSTGRLMANIATRTLVVMEGAVFQGSCLMQNAEHVPLDPAQREESEHLYATQDDEHVMN